MDVLEEVLSVVLQQGALPLKDAVHLVIVKIID